jgi:predicted NBD/HSP70 family sugar kinase
VSIIRHSLDDYLSDGFYQDITPSSMGVGIMGRVNVDDGVWEQIAPERSKPIDLAADLSRAYGISCFIDNDVKCATLAEQRWGQGHSKENFIYINVGTGVAAGAIVNGSLIRGTHWNAGEVGHTSSCLSLGVECVCGRKDCVEMIVSGLGMDTCARMLSSKYTSQLTIPNKAGIRVRVNDIYQLCRQGDELCNVLVDNASEALSCLIMNLARVYDPDCVVLGGGVVSDGYLLDHVRPLLTPSAIRFMKGGVVLTTLDANVIGLLGAAVTAIRGNETLLD